MKANEITAWGYYWCSHDLRMWVPDGEESPREWHVVNAEDSVLYHAGADFSTHVSEVPDYVDFHGPMVAPPGPWLLIETAPRDGTKVDVWVDGQRVPNVEWRICRCWGDVSGPTWAFEEWHDDERHWHEVDGEPTHWMPLPRAP